jgi:hypothetical protein
MGIEVVSSLHGSRETDGLDGTQDKESWFLSDTSDAATCHDARRFVLPEALIAWMRL